MQTIRLGVIGCGFIGTCHLEAARQQPGVILAAVVDLDERRARETAKRFGVATAVADAELVLRDPAIDAVVLAIPTAGRAQLAIRALQAGKHVLLEKPTAMNVREIDQMIAARGELVCACCSARYRFSQAARVATEFVASGALGELRLLRSRTVDPAGVPPAQPPPNWRVSRSLNGGGILVNWGTYDLDFLLGITGWSVVPQEVLARTWRIAPQLSVHVAPGSDAESHAAGLIQCERGMAIALERGEFLAAAGEHTVEIIGARGSLRVTMLPVNGEASVIHDTVVPEQGPVSRTLWRAPAAEAGLDGNPTVDFLEAIRNGRPPRTGLEQARVITQITDAIYASAATGRAVSIPRPAPEPAVADRAVTRPVPAPVA